MQVLVVTFISKLKMMCQEELTLNLYLQVVMLEQDGYFDYVGQDRSNGATVGDKPITEFLREQTVTYLSSVYSAVNTSTTLADLRNLMQLSCS